MKIIEQILILTVVTFFNSICLNAQNELFCSSDSDSLIPGNIYLIKLKTNQEYLGKVVKVGSGYMKYKDAGNDMHKISRGDIKECFNIFTNYRFNRVSSRSWIIDLNYGGYYYENVTLLGNGVKNDSLKFLVNNKIIKLPLSSVDKIEVRASHSGDLEADPLNLFLPYLIFSSSRERYVEFDISDLDNQWKAAQIKYLIYK